MDTLRRLVREAHRRSLWQVLGLYAIAAWGVIQVVEALTQSAGLPDWTPGMALALLLVGLPIVLATAFVQEGGPRARGDGDDPTRAVGAAERAPARAATRTPAVGGSGPAGGSGSVGGSGAPTVLRRHLTWKRAFLGGGAAFALLAGSAGGYLALWAGGIGPIGSLVAQDVISEGERVVLADFEAPSGESELASIVTEALRIDLTRASILTVMEPAEVRGVLARMGRDPAASVPGDLALELAQREGVKAVLRGDVGRAGSGYLLTASLVAAEDGRTLAAFRETAGGEDDVIDAVDRLSRSIRERVGESLRSIRRGEPLSRVTTASLPALRVYTEAIRASEAGDYLRSIQLLEDAVERDPDFAMAWRKLGIELGNTGIDPERREHALTRAYELRDRLTERERYLAEAAYHARVRDDAPAAVNAYRRLLELDPNDAWALNNIALLLAAEGRLEEAVEHGYRGVAAGSTLAGANLVAHLVQMGRLADADSLLPRLAGRGAHPFLGHSEVMLRLRQGRAHEADSLARALGRSADLPATLRSQLFWGRIAAGILQGHLDRADALSLEAARRFRAENAPFAAAASAVIPGFTRAFLDLDLPADERERLLRLGSDLESTADDRRGILDAVLGTLARAGDAERAERTAAALRAEIPDDAPRAVRALPLAAEAQIAAARGDTVEALQLVDDYRVEASCERCFAFERSAFLQALGRTDEAIRELEAGLTGIEVVFPPMLVVQELGILSRLAPLYEEVGRRDEAADVYRALVERWVEADPALQPRVRAWRERIAALERG